MNTIAPAEIAALMAQIGRQARAAAADLLNSKNVTTLKQKELIRK